MADFTYTIRDGAASHPGYPNFNDAVDDFANNNRCEDGVNTIGASDTLTFKVSGFLDFAGTNQTISGITVTAGGAIVVEADTTPFNSAVRRLGYGESYDGFKFNTTAFMAIDQANVTVQNLVMSSGVGSGYGVISMTGTSGYRSKIKSCVINNTGVSRYYTACANLTYTDIYNYRGKYYTCFIWVT